MAITSFPPIGKLVPPLGSDKDGEILAAVAAIHCSLRGAAFDWHDLVAVIEKHSPRQRAKPDLLLNELLALAEFSDWEREFVGPIREQMIDKPGFAPTPKQYAVLNRLLHKKGRAQ